MGATEPGPPATVRDDDVSLAASVLSAIHRHGVHPFIVVRIECVGEEILICRSQNERLAFADRLAEASCKIGGSLLVDALIHVLRYDIYEAAFALFDWAVSDQPGRIAVLGAEANPSIINSGHPVYDVTQSLPAQLRDRTAMLLAVFRAYEAGKGNVGTRLRFVEAFGFALSRCCGLLKDYEEGLDVINRVGKLGSYYVHLRTCSHALDRKRRGVALPPHLEKFVGHDSGALDDVACSLPYIKFDITRGGAVRNCCVAPIPIGNLNTNDISEIVNSDTAQRFRKSIIDGSYRYCDHLHCKPMLRRQLPRKSSPQVANDPVMRAAVEQGRVHVDSIRILSFGYDNSCNLSCPSCRREVIIEKSSGSVNSDAVVAGVKTLLPHIKMLYINSSGEFLVSKPSRRLLQAIDRRSSPNLTISIISNGTLFSETEWAKFSNIHGMIGSIRISTDAAYPATFEKLRRGAKWDRFFENLKFLGRLKACNQIGSFHMSFTYQVANFREMKAFVALVESVGANCAIFELLYPNMTAMTETEYRERAVHLADHPDQQEFLEIIADPIFQQKNIQSDFERAIIPRRASA